MSRLVAGGVAFLAGFAVMGLELTAVRLLAPRFGDSAYVWTNVIGVMLAALAAGAWLGGRLADAAHGAGRLSNLFLIAGGLCATVPLVAGPLGGWLLPPDLQLDSAMSAMVRGSLVATLLLFSPPVILVGCMTPMLVSTLVRGGGMVGSASGLVAATGTIGSLLGTFATTHLLVPDLGSRVTIWICAALIMGCGLLLRPGAKAAAAVAIPLALIPWSYGPLRAVGGDDVLLAEVESQYQYLQVVGQTYGGEETVQLKINEGLDSFHSIAVGGTPYSGGRYYDYHGLAPYLAGDGVVAADLRVLSLGAAAGTFSRVFAAAHPGCLVDGVEIDPAVVELGEEYFGGRSSAGRVYAGVDARVFVESANTPYDVVVVDAYERQIYIPAHVASREFFEAIQRCLRPGGVVSVNAGGRGFDDPVVHAIGNTVAAVFGEAHVFRVPRSRNFLVIGRSGAPPDPSTLANVSHPDAEMTRVIEDARASGAWRRVTGGYPILTDDQPLLDVLQEQALTAHLGFDGLVPMSGGDAPAGVAARATDQLQVHRDYEGALATIQTAHTATAQLRLLAAGARWLLRDLEGAELEYRAALQIAEDEPTRAYAEENLAGVMAELEAAAAAGGAARRNGWLAIAASLCVFGALGFSAGRIG